ncbi:hypothetical protein SCHPADRAFT_898323 [Schizopora paradoxa]|uniref:Uncharacterized protein n=1 Tax=Schizopora paradoxa TaxID=27342 RepID=A0A0H2S627_9AGAM|nr:hypothetical protein SCHPADRAFT_898323 [Schizopora paradoxa]
MTRSSRTTPGFRRADIQFSVSFSTSTSTSFRRSSRPLCKQIGTKDNECHENHGLKPSTCYKTWNSSNDSQLKKFNTTSRQQQFERIETSKRPTVHDQFLPDFYELKSSTVVWQTSILVMNTSRVSKATSGCRLKNIVVYGVRRIFVRKPWIWVEE